MPEPEGQVEPVKEVPVKIVEGEVFEEKKESENPKVTDLKNEDTIQQAAIATQQVPHHRKEFYGCIEDDPFLKQFEHDINARQLKFKQ